MCNTSIWARRAQRRRERPPKVHITLCYVHDVAVKIPDRPKSAAAAFEKYENSLGMLHRTLRYIHNGAKILYILSISAYFQRTCFRVAFSGLFSPLGRGSVQKIQKFSWDATQNSLLYSQWSQLLYAIKKWSQLLSSAEFQNQNCWRIHCPHSMCKPHYGNLPRYAYCYDPPLPKWR